MRLRASGRVGAFQAQREALMHAEAMLLVDDREPELAEIDLLLKQRVRADRDLRLRRSRRAPAPRACPCASGCRRATPPRRRAARATPRTCVVLLGEDFGRRHDRDLIAVFHRLQRSQRRDDRLAAADIALQQALHRMRLREVGADLAQALAAARASA